MTSPNPHHRTPVSSATALSWLSSSRVLLLCRGRRQSRTPRSSLLALLPACVAFLAAANGAWLHRVSPRDHARPNPLLTTPESRNHAARAGAQLYANECAKCHASDGGGLHGRPPVISGRIAEASDGDLFWLMTNGSPWHGMPAWPMLPAGERWQLVAYLRSLNQPDDPPPPPVPLTPNRFLPTHTPTPPPPDPSPDPSPSPPQTAPPSPSPSQPPSQPQSFGAAR